MTKCSPCSYAITVSWQCSTCCCAITVSLQTVHHVVALLQFHDKVFTM